MQTPIDDGSDWSALHELSLVYLTLVYHPGRARFPEEARSEGRTLVHETLRMWYPDASDERINRALQEALLVHISPMREQMLAIAVNSLRQSMPRDQRIAVLSDLADLAMEEGFVVPDEASFIERLARDWDIERDVQ